MFLSKCYGFSLLLTTCSAWSLLHSRDSYGLGIEPGSLVKPTKGGVWPKPQNQISFEGVLFVDPANFEFQINGYTCEILEQAIIRYKKILTDIRLKIRNARKRGRFSKNNVEGKEKHVALGQLNLITITLLNSCETWPHINMDEQYELRVNSPDFSEAAVLQSQSIWGILRGLETFFQTLYPDTDSANLLINSTMILDFPRFPHRGLHIDTARHFIPVRIILALLDGIAMNKLNVFHWHIVDDQSFPFVSTVWPLLSERGAFSPLHIYTKKDIAKVIEAARVRGIRVIAEFDTPGHTRSWGNGYPELLTKCYDAEGNEDGSLGPMNPLSNFTYSFMTSLLQELVTVFPDQFLHLGGDEVPFDCWESNPTISKYMQDNNITSSELEEIFIKQVIDTATSLNITPLVWQEVFDNGVSIPDNTIVHVWKDWIDYMGEMSNVTKAGYKALLSSCWYLDHLTSGGDWYKFYDCDPTFFYGTEAQRKKVIGGEACMWAEVVDANNIQQRIWPRASAVAEKLWSAADVDSVASAAKRLEEHVCRMNMRGIPAQPANGPGFCPYQLYK